jgi:GNAT-family acetyltransferase (TIGR03103 family)
LRRIAASLVVYLEQPNFTPRFLRYPANAAVAAARNYEIGSGELQMTKRHTYQQRITRRNYPSLQVMSNADTHEYHQQTQKDVVIECGWGRLIFGHTFNDIKSIRDILLQERENQRDIALYLRDPHVALSYAPQDLFLDPSHTYRLWISNYHAGRVVPRGFHLRKIQRPSDTDAINRILRKCNMVPADPDFIWQHRDSSVLTYIVAEDPVTGAILGTVMGIDHHEAFADPEKGSSLWCLAVDPQTSYSGVGKALVAYLADYYTTRGCAYMDLSVMHDNHEAICLYEKMGFVRVPVFCIKRKNSINEQLFVGPAQNDKLNPYAEIIVNEARRRGIAVNILDGQEGYFELTFGGRSIICRESLTELTSAIAMSRCANKAVTHNILRQAGLNVPEQRLAGNHEENKTFLHKHRSIVVKPLDSEQGRGITVNISKVKDMKIAIKEASRYSSDVLLEKYVSGQDLRIVLINYEVVAAAIRKPPEINGNGNSRIIELIEKQSRRREAATQGESSIPIDRITEKCVRQYGYSMEDILPAGKKISIRETANLHTGGTIHDVTEKLHPTLKAVAEEAARLLKISVVGLDMLVKDPAEDEYVIIEANERPGLANHEPQPVAERFIDFLFPQTRRI